MGRGLEPAPARQRIGRGKPLGRVVHLAVINANANHLVAPVGQHPFDHLGGGCGRGLAVNRCNQTAGDAEIGFGIGNGTHDAAQRLRVGQARLLGGARGVPEELGIAHLVRSGILQVFVGQAVQVVGAADEFGVQRTQHPQHAHGLFTPGVEGLDLGIADGRARPAHQVGERGAPHGAEQMAVQLHLGQGMEKGVQRVCGRDKGGHGRMLCSAG